MVSTIKANITNNKLFFNESNYRKFKHKSGLTIILNVMPECSYAYAAIGVKYGSIDNSFKKALDKDFIVCPEGIAHFLEHKMFENKDGEDTFQKYAKTGAIANAYTGFDETCYLFLCSNNFKESLEILINTVTQPYFTNENVRKEQEIIGQEINMCQDDPHWRCYFGVLQGLYSQVPLFCDIAGTQESIKKITADCLYQCYNMFYNLNNMVLSIAGNFSIDDVIEITDKILVKSEPLNIVHKIYDEPQTSLRKEANIKLSVKTPLMGVGFKHKPATTLKDNFILNIKYSLLNDLIVGNTSNLYHDLYYSELIDKPISFEVVNGQGYLLTVFIVETKQPDIVKNKIFEEINRIKKDGVNKDALTSIKKSYYGNYVMDMNSPKTVATNHMDGYLDNLDFREWQDILLNVTKNELEELIEKTYNYESSTVFMVEPLDE